VRRQGLEPRTRGLRVRCSIRFFTLNWYREVPESAMTCHPVRSLISTTRPPIPHAAGAYRDVRANMERTARPKGLDHTPNIIIIARRGVPEIQNPGVGRASMMDTIRNLRLADDAIRLGQRHHRDIARLDFSYTFRIPPIYRADRGGTCPPDQPRFAVHRPSVGRDPVTRQPVPEAHEIRPSRRWINQPASALRTARVLLGGAYCRTGVPQPCRSKP
jgi:hypothetical protein